MKRKSPLARIWEMGKAEHGRLKLAICLAIAAVLLGLLPYIAAAKILGLLIRNVRTIRPYALCCLLALGGYGFKTALYSLALSHSHKSAYAILKDIRRRILDKLPKLPLGTIVDTSSGKMKQVIVDQIEGMETTLAHLLPEMTANLLAPLCILILLFVTDWRMALLSLVSLPLGFLFLMGTMRNYAKDYEGSVKANQSMSETVVEYISGIEVIKAYNQGENSYSKFIERVKANASYYYNWMKRCQFGMSMALAIAPTTLLTVLPLGYLFYHQGTLRIENFLSCIILSMAIVAPLIRAMTFVDTLATMGTTVKAVDEFLQGKEQEHPQTPVALGKPDIVLQDVSFAYHDGQEVLHDIHLEIPAGTLTALVGPSGGGKSTIAKLIAGFWDVDEGRIMLCGQEEKKIPLEQLYDQVAFVSQDNYLFDDTVRENIRMGRLTASDAEVEAVAQASGCDAFIRKLEQAYETRVGGGGTRLSGGERQRISIARAMLKDAPIVVLDEATAYIDPENEALIQRAISQLTRNKTVIVIAHRLSSIVQADQIVVIRDGHVEASGTHEHLLSNCKLYSDMWTAHMGVRKGEVA